MDVILMHLFEFRLPLHSDSMGPRQFQLESELLTKLERTRQRRFRGGSNVKRIKEPDHMPRRAEINRRRTRHLELKPNEHLGLSI